MLQQRKAAGKACVDLYVKMVTHKVLLLRADTLRAMYIYCFDASPLFAGNGFGFNPEVNPVNEVPVGAATFFQKVMSREFVIPSFPVTPALKAAGDLVELRFPTIPNAEASAIPGVK